MNDLYLGLGSNLGDKKNNLLRAVEFVTDKIGRVKKSSQIFVSKPYGFQSNNDFYNMVIYLKTHLQPAEVIMIIKLIEKTMGRKKIKFNDQYEDRLIDIDILYYNDLIIDEIDLKIPHKEIKNRKFVLYPMCEISKNFIDPREQKTIEELLLKLELNLK